MMAKLTEEQRSQSLPDLLESGWEQLEDRDAIGKEFAFSNFVEAFGWMTRAALVAEKMNHHPEWTNVYRNVEVVLTTHSAGGLTELDIRLAKRMDVLAGG